MNTPPKTTTHLFLFFLSIFLLYACSNNEEKAKKMLESAKAYTEKNEFGAAKSQIDSLKMLYPEEAAVVEDGSLLMRKIELKDRERSLKYLDSLLIINVRQADSLKKTLLFEKNAEYQTFGIYSDKNQTSARIAGKSCLKFDVDETGEMNVAAIGYGIGKKKFNSLKVETDNAIYAETHALPEDGGNNYVSELNGVSTRILNFTRGKDAGFIDFIYIYKDRPLKISYIGADVVYYSFSLTKNEKEALRKVYELSNALLNIKDISEKIKTIN